METIGLRDLNLQQMLSAGEARAPAETGMPDVQFDLAPEVDSLADLLIADRDRERNRAVALA